MSLICPSYLAKIHIFVSIPTWWRCKMKDFVNIINGNGSEAIKLALLKRKIASSKYKNGLGPNTVWNYKTPLSAAVANNYLSIIKYLIDDLGVDPNEVIPQSPNQKQLFDYQKTAFSLANVTKKDGVELEIAKYLASKLNSYSLSSDGMYEPLTMAITSDNFEVVKALLTAIPALRHIKTRTENETLLHKAVMTNAANVSQYLIETGLDEDILATDNAGMSPYYIALYKSSSKILTTMLAKKISAVTCNIFGKPELTTQIVLDSKEPQEDKMRCLTILLAAGAGLNLCLLPEELFTLYKIKKQPTFEFILVGQEKIQEVWKNKFITQVSQLQNFYQNPNWRFNTEQILIATQNPLVHELPHIKKIVEILNGNTCDLKPVEPKTLVLSSEAIIKIREKEISAMNATELSQISCHYWKDLTSPNMLSTPEYFTVFSKLLTCLNNPYVDFDMIEDNKPISNLLTKEANRIIKLVAGKKSIFDQDNPQMLSFLVTFNDSVKRLLWKHKKTLMKKEFANLYSALQVLKINTAYYLTELYEQADKTDLAFSALMEAIGYSRRLNEPFNQYKAFWLFTTCKHLLALGWVKEAKGVLGEAIDIYDIHHTQEDYFYNTFNALISAISIHVESFPERLSILTQFVDFLKAYQSVQQNKEIDEIVKRGSQLITQIKEVIFASNHLANVLMQSLVTCLNTTNFEQAMEPEQLIKQFSECTIQSPKEKIKTRPDGNQLAIEQDADQVDNSVTPVNYGFTQISGYSPAIPVLSSAIPKETLFITIPCNNPAFLPFMSLIYDKESGHYHEVHSIAERGYNKQGVKFGSLWQNDPHQQPKKVPIARLKILGAEGEGKLRATGTIQQVCQTAPNKFRKLYVIDRVVDKKEEQRKGYRF